ncbi:MAG TPA: hypothetical protein VFP50_04915, partial [Anaeromyxobacteraceae bacterium]|nr:hypothetical protein [Anaeromyxobacteraceae bacterium]
MPVSKKRKKDGKPVHRTTPVTVEGAEHAHGPESKPAAAPVRGGKPGNPFVAARPTARGSQRGR